MLLGLHLQYHRRRKIVYHVTMVNKQTANCRCLSTNCRLGNKLNQLAHSCQNAEHNFIDEKRSNFCLTETRSSCYHAVGLYSVQPGISNVHINCYKFFQTLWYDLFQLYSQTHIHTSCILHSHHSHSWYKYSTSSQGKCNLISICHLFFASGWNVTLFQTKWEMPFVTYSYDLWIFGRPAALNHKDAD